MLSTDALVLAFAVFGVVEILGGFVVYEWAPTLPTDRKDRSILRNIATFVLIWVPAAIIPIIVAVIAALVIPRKYINTNDDGSQEESDDSPDARKSPPTGVGGDRS